MCHWPSDLCHSYHSCRVAPGSAAGTAGFISGRSSRLSLSGQRAAQALGTRAPCVGASPLIFSGPVPLALRASLSPVPASSGRRCQGCAAFLTSLPKRRLWVALCVLPAPRGAGEELQDFHSSAGGTSAYTTDSGLWCKRQAQGFHRGLWPGEGTVSLLSFPRCSSPAHRWAISAPRGAEQGLDGALRPGWAPGLAWPCTLSCS